MDPLSALKDAPLGARGSLRSEIGARLLSAIFRGELPAGTRLMVMKLAARFGTSSTPVREALVELEAIGVVQFIPNRGAEVIPFGPKELEEIYQVRRVLEAEATRCACDKLDRVLVEELHQEMKELLRLPDDATWSQRATVADRRFHAAIVEACGSRRLTNEIHRYDILVQTIREIIGSDRPAIELALMEHVRIVDALLADDAEAAARAMAAHVDSAARVCQAAMFKSGG